MAGLTPAPHDRSLALSHKATAGQAGSQRTRRKLKKQEPGSGSYGFLPCSLFSLPCAFLFFPSRPLAGQPERAFFASLARSGFQNEVKREERIVKGKGRRKSTSHVRCLTSNERAVAIRPGSAPFTVGSARGRKMEKAGANPLFPLVFLNFFNRQRPSWSSRLPIPCRPDRGRALTSSYRVSILKGSPRSPCSPGRPEKPEPGGSFR